jgi:hypothetical protein
MRNFRSANYIWKMRTPKGVKGFVQVEILYCSDAAIFKGNRQPSQPLPSRLTSAQGRLNVFQRRRRLRNALPKVTASKDVSELQGGL